MAGLLFAVEQIEGIPSRAYDKLPPRLRPVLEGASWSCHHPSDGPGGKPCWVLNPQPVEGSGGDAAQDGYFRDRQKWLQSGDYWIGFETGRPPRPADLARPNSVAGYPIKLADGNEWVIPAIHAGHACQVPQEFDVDDKGAVVVSYEERYAALQAKAAKWWDMVVAGTAIREHPEDWYRFAIELLAVNYRVDEWIVGKRCLNLLRVDPKFLWGILYAAFGGPAIVAEVEAQKKTATPPAGG